MRALACVGVLVASTSLAWAGGIAGLVVDEGSRDPLIGVTVVATPCAASATAPTAYEGSCTTITEDDGTFRIDLAPGTYVVTFFYGETTIERRDVRVRDQDEPAPLFQRMPPETATACRFDEATPLAYTGRPSTWATITAAATPLVRRRDHLSLAALDARARPATAVTTIGGALRLPGAPAIASELIEEVELTTTTPGPASPGASGGHLGVALVTGTNRHHGQARLELGPDARLVMTHDGPFDRNHVWWSTGVVLARDGATEDHAGAHGAQVLTTLGFAIDEDADDHGLVSALATWLPGGGRDLWSDATLVIRRDDRRRQIAIGVTAEALDQPAATATARVVDGSAARPGAVDRLAGRLGLTQRWRGTGDHTTQLGAEVGMGHADDTEHGDQRAYLGDAWAPRPNWTVDASVRWDRRELGTARIDAVLPRLAVAWDPSEEGRGSWFASAERVARLDERDLGAWRDAAPVAFDQATVGVTRDPRDDLRITLAVRGRRPAVVGAEVDGGVEGEVLWLPPGTFAGVLTGSTLEGAISARARFEVACERNRYTAAAIGRIDRDGHGWGGSAQWARRYTTTPDLRIAVELFDLDDPSRRGGRVALAAQW
ncbi:MAG: TonB-dependent receptor [Myxococcales bacterium]|nr:TonB-dependent receptor [Myxococcales bacterium]